MQLRDTAPRAANAQRRGAVRYPPAESVRNGAQPASATSMDMDSADSKLAALNGSIDLLCDAVKEMTSTLGAFRAEVKADRGVQLSRHNGYVDDLSSVLEHVSEHNRLMIERFEAVML